MVCYRERQSKRGRRRDRESETDSEAACLPDN